MIYLPKLLVVFYCNTPMILHWYACQGPSDSNVAVIMNHQLELINRWTLTNKMRLNHSKSSVMWFKFSNRHQSPDPPATLVRVSLWVHVVSKRSYLRLIFDNQLKCWKGVQVNVILRVWYFPVYFILYQFGVLHFLDTIFKGCNKCRIMLYVSVKIYISMIMWAICTRH